MKVIIRMTLYIVFAMVFLGGCRSIRSVQKDEAVTAFEKNLSHRLMAPLDFSDLSAKVVVTSQSKTISGQLRMRWDESIQISLTALGMVELGRLEFLPEKVILINRINRTYSELPYSQIPYIAGAHIDYYTFQSLLWNRVFVSGEKDISKALKSLTYLSDQSAAGSIYKEKSSGFRFLIDNDNNLKGTFKNIQSYQFALEYDNFRNLYGSVFFPQKWLVSVISAASEFSVVVNLDNLSAGKGDWASSTKINSRYTKVSLQEMLESII